MMARTMAEMKEGAGELSRLIKEQQPEWHISVIEQKSYIGGGSLPGTHMPALAVRITSAKHSSQEISLKFRRARVPVVPYIDDDAVLLNLRTVSKEDLQDIAAACRAGG
jgi:L-seryl-tRNA(Ser) seleniumtransferase